nr:hypothetical protein [Tanacetum cinerariifolium]
SRDRPSMLAPGRYPQWRSRFLRYVDTRPNVPEHTTVETPTNMSPENKAHFLAEKEAIHLILTGIGDDIYSTVDACQTTQEIFYKLMNEMIRNNLTVTTMQVNVQFLQQLQPEWSRTSSNAKNKNVDTTPQFKNDNQSGQFGTQRIVNVAAARENVGSKVVQLSGIQCFNCKEYGHFAKECKKPKRVKDSVYHKEKMLLSTWLRSRSFQQLIQAPIQSQRNSNTCLVETDDTNIIPDSPDMCKDDIQNEQNDVVSDDEHVALANLIANLKLDVDKNKKIQKQLKKENTTLAQELKECKAILAETSKSLRESISVRDSFLVALQTKQAEFEKYKAFNDRTIDYDKLKRKLNDALG